MTQIRSAVVDPAIVRIEDLPNYLRQHGLTIVGPGPRPAYGPPVLYVVALEPRAACGACGHGYAVHDSEGGPCLCGGCDCPAYHRPEAI